MNSILLITDIFPPDIGGPATFMDQLAAELARRGQRVTVVCTSAQPREPADQQRTFRVRRIPRWPPSLFQSLRVRAALAQEVLRHKWIFTNGLEYPTFQVCALLRRAYVLKIVGDWVWEAARNNGWTMLGIDEFQTAAAQGAPWERLTVKRDRFVRGARVVITPSEYLRRMVIGWGIEANRVVTVLNGILREEFAAFQPRRRSDVLEIMFSGRLTNWKGVDTLLRAAAGLRNIHLTLIGDGPELAHLSELAQQLGLGAAVEFLGAQPREAMLARIARADVLVLASGYEGLSHTLLEASALGVPCIASDCGGNPEIIRHGENGLLVPYGNVDRLREALENLQRDEELRYRLACNAKRSAERFDFRETVRRTVEIIQSDPQGLRGLAGLGAAVTHVMGFREQPGLAPFSGAENHLFTLMTAQQQHGWRVELVMLILQNGPRLSAKIKELEQQGIAVFSVAVRKNNPFSDGRALSELCALFRPRRAHVIHTHLEHADFLGRLAAWFAGCRHIVSTTHNPEPFYATWRWRMTLKLWDRFTRQHIAISNYVRDYLVTTVGIPADKITTIYYGVECPSSIRPREELRSAYDIPLDRFAVGFIGRLSPQKNVGLFIDALDNLPNVYGVIVGGGELSDALHSQVARKGMTNARFLGYQPSAADIIPMFDALCLPSRWEGLGLVLIEAMLRRVAIIASRAGAIPEILGDGRYGLLFDSDDVSGLTATIQFAMRERAAMREMAIRAFEYAQRVFSVEAMAQQTIAVYETVTRSK